MIRILIDMAGYSNTVRKNPIAIGTTIKQMKSMYFRSSKRDEGELSIYRIYMLFLLTNFGWQHCLVNWCSHGSDAQCDSALLRIC